MLRRGKKSEFDLPVVFRRGVVEGANQVIDLGRGIAGRFGIGGEVMLAHALCVDEGIGPLGQKCRDNFFGSLGVGGVVLAEGFLDCRLGERAVEQVGPRGVALDMEQ